MTLEQVLQLAATARSSPAGSQRLRDAAASMSQIALLLRTNQAIAQLLWWSADLEPIPPGKPVMGIDMGVHQ